MVTEPLLATVTLSRGSRWTYKLRGKPGDLYPAVGTAEAVFYDTAGGVAATIVGTVTPLLVLFEADPADVEEIPHGAGFEIFVTPDGEDRQMVRYGTAVRREVRFPDAPPTDTSETALLFTDNFQRTLLGPKWIIKYGKPKILQNTSPIPDGLGPDGIFFASAATLFYAPLNGDDCTINVNVVNAGAGKTTIVLCSDQAMTSYLGVQIETGISNNKVHIVRGTAPLTMVDVMTAVNSTTANNDNFAIKYNSLTDTISVYKNDSSTALIAWTDASHDVLHGAGYRYMGFNFQASLLQAGVEITSWHAQDGI